MFCSRCFLPICPRDRVCAVRGADLTVVESVRSADDQGDRPSAAGAGGPGGSASAAAAQISTGGSSTLPSADDVKHHDAAVQTDPSSDA